MTKNKEIILYAEDNEYVRSSVVNILETVFQEHDLEIFADGSSLRQRLEGDVGNVGAVVTDNNMPGVNGSDIINQFARREGYEHVKFILHYFGDEKRGEEAVRNGAFGYVLKPASPHEMLEEALEK